VFCYTDDSDEHLFQEGCMGRSAAKQTLSYPLRLPDVVQADALRLLDVSREADQRDGGRSLATA
jgi:hypothetical protein